MVGQLVLDQLIEVQILVPDKTDGISSGIG